LTLAHVWPSTRAQCSLHTRNAPSCFASQIYNEAIFDLLDITTQPQDITLHDDGRGRLAIAGLRGADVRNEQEALALFFEVGVGRGRSQGA
jgi:hypothetical protein